MKALSNSGIFAFPDVKKKVIISLAYIFSLTLVIGIMTWELPKNSNYTESFILIYYSFAITLIYPYTFVFENKDFIKKLSAIFPSAFTLLLFGNWAVNYQRDLSGCDPRNYMSVFLIVMVIISGVRSVKLNSVTPN